MKPRKSSRAPVNDSSATPPQTRVVNAGVMETSNDEQDAPTYRATRYIVYPTGFSRVAEPSRRNWCLVVEGAGDGWAVRWRSKCLSYRNVWEYEPAPKGRSTDFLARCRFSERAAILRAKQAVDKLVINGMTFDEFVAHIREEAATEAREALQNGTSGSPADPHPSAPVLPLHVRLRRLSGQRRSDP